MADLGHRDAGDGLTMARRASSSGSMVTMDIDTKALEEMARAMRGEGGKRLRADLAAGLRKAMEPIRDKARAEIMSMPSGGLRRGGAPLRASIAREVRAEVRIDAREPGARLVAGNNSIPRGFKQAPRRTVAARGWRHPVFGNKNVWVTQPGKRGWFYRPQRSGERSYREAVAKVLKEMAQRIARRAR